MNNSASNTSNFTNLNLFESSKPNDYAYKYSYNSDMYIQSYLCLKLVTDF